MNRCVTICGLLLPALVSGQAKPQAPRALAITHVTVIDVNGGRLIPDQTVVVRNRHIVALGATASTSAPPDARAIDGSGKFLLPGLWDMHVHLTPGELAKTDLALLVANGITGARSMSGAPNHQALRRDVTSGVIPGPRLVLAGPILEQPPPDSLANVISMAGKVPVRSPDEGTAVVRAQKAAGYDFIKVYNGLTKPAYDAVVAEAAKQQMKVAGHVPFAAGLRGVLAARQASIEHMRGYSELLIPSDAPLQPSVDLRSRAISWQYADTTRMKALAEETRRAGTWNCLTLAVRLLEGPQGLVDEFLKRPQAEYLTPYLRAGLADRHTITWLSNFSDADFRAAGIGHAREDALVRALLAAGAGILAGTDIGPWGFSLHNELALMVKAGLTPQQALQAATINPARYFGATDSLGTVSVGKLADLLLLDADPLKDINNTTQIRAVVANGLLYDRNDLDSLLSAAKKAANSPPRN